METRFLPIGELGALVDALRASGQRVVAPAADTQGRVSYREVEKAGEIRWDAPSRRSLKSLFMPPSEPILRWRQRGREVELEEAPPAAPPTVVLGALPCDAAAPDIVDRVMNWDQRDTAWNSRRESVLVASVACDGWDEACFCGITGPGPAGTRGADVLLIAVEGGFLVEVVTERGKALLALHGERFRDPTGGEVEEASTRRARAVAEQKEAPMDLHAVGGWLARSFKDPLWEEVALRCHGCGACAMVCPTCHCFDIVDEAEGPTLGTRRRNWDTCQAAVFTAHASGHNPRPAQDARFRQRILHKFHIYPERFGEVLCTGCGRCIRACPGGMDLLEVLRAAGGTSPQGEAP